MHILNLLRTLMRGFLLVVMAIPSMTAVHSKVEVQAIWKTSAANRSWNAATDSSETTGESLWVDAVNGNNSNDGRSLTTALRTIQRAADLSGPGTTVHIQPGVYRESVVPAQSGNASGSIRYIAEGGPGTAVIRGSEPSSALTWIRLTSNSIGLPPGVDPTNIYYADLSAWGLSSPPRFVVELDNHGEVLARLPLAREPDWPVVTEWKYHEFWWAADGGTDVAACNPPTDPDPFNCDSASRSLTQLTDRHNDVEPAGTEPGNLTTLGNLTGANLAVIDTNIGTSVFRRTIVAHDVVAGRITVDQDCGTGMGALGWGSKYYVEGLPYLMDTPGEWLYDQMSGRLYLWPRVAGNPAAMNIEISRREDGFILQDRSYITLDGLTIEFFNRNIVYVHNEFNDKSHHDIIRNALLRYGNIGIWLKQWVDPNAPVDMSIDGFIIEDSEIAFMDSKALYIDYSWPGSSSQSAADFIRPGVFNTVIRRNELHHLGFYSDGVGALIVFPDHLRFEENYIHHIAHIGVQFMRSVIQSSKKFGFSPEEIKTGDILIRDNIFEKACQNLSDCGALKISGTPPDRQVFRDLLVTGNIFRDTFGWTYIREKRGQYNGGLSAVKGMGGFGMYVDNASGIYAYRNIAYNDAFTGFKFAGAWRDGDIVYYNNTTANSLFGFHFGGWRYDTHGNVNTQVANNIIVNHEANGILTSDADGIFDNTMIDHNLYYNNGWRPHDQGGTWGAGDLFIATASSTPWYITLQDIQAGTNWEDHGIEGNPAFWNYDVSDHDYFDGSWPDLHLTTASSNAIDRGVSALPDSLTALLNKFGVFDPHWGNAYDIGRYEAGFAILSNPSASAVEPGGVAHYTLSLYPLDLPFPVTLNISSPDPSLIISLEPTVITSGTTTTLTVTDTHSGSGLMPGLWYALQISGEGAGFTNDTLVHLLVGGTRFYLPMVTR